MKTTNMTIVEDHEYKEFMEFKKRKENKKPIQLKPEEIDLAPLRRVCQQYIDFVDSKDYHDDNDYMYYIKETALQTIFGKNVYDFINKKI